jgi:hypothetical protein
MEFRDLVVAKKPMPDAPHVAAAAVGGPAGGGQDSETPVFITPQSLVTFPGASLAVLILWKVLGLLFGTWVAGNWLPVVLSLGIGALIFYLSITPNMTKRDLWLGAFLALLNSCYVALFVLGVPLTFPQAGSVPQTQP